MTSRLNGLVAAFALAAALSGSGPNGSSVEAPIERAYERLYNFDFRGTHEVLDTYIAAHPADPLPYAVRGAAFLFYELDRLMILEAEFFTDDRRITEKRKLKPDPEARQRLFEALAAARLRAEKFLAIDPQDRNALFALCMTTGIQTDYTVFVEKRHFSGLAQAKRSHRFALDLLKLDPTFYDAYLTTGLSEYLVGSLPFFVRWFVRFDAVEGSKEQAVRNLELVSERGRYLGPFARILLAVIHLREKRPHESERLLTGLHREFPENPLIRKELARLSERLAAE